MAASATKGPRYRQTPLWRDSNRFLVEVETAVRTFPRYHKYTLGSDLRRQAMNICRLVARAAQSPAGPERARLLQRLSWPVARGSVLRRARRRRGQPFCQIFEDGYLRGGMKQRSLRWIFTPPASHAAAGVPTASPDDFPDFRI